MEVRGYKLLELHTILLCATSYINENFIFSNQNQIDDINYGLIVHAFLLSVFKDQGFSNFKLMHGKNLNAKEHFWLENEDSIRLADYGTSNSGLLKTLYRSGLSYRYGSMMQTVSGIHYNFSFSDEFFESIRGEEDLQTFKNKSYLSLIRNFRRNAWMILYLFGSSPRICPRLIFSTLHMPGSSGEIGEEMFALIPGHMT